MQTKTGWHSALATRASQCARIGVAVGTPLCVHARRWIILVLVLDAPANPIYILTLGLAWFASPAAVTWIVLTRIARIPVSMQAICV